jgi:hypothetical protein
MQGTAEVRALLFFWFFGVLFALSLSLSLSDTV